jgi:dihydroxyacid dehydratase/phosphogluconate dehydratase
MRPTTMLFRNLVSMDVEESIRANPLDGVVLLVGCDKTTPAVNTRLKLNRAKTRLNAESSLTDADVESLANKIIGFAKTTHTKEIAAKVEALLKIAHESEAEANV